MKSVYTNFVKIDRLKWPVLTFAAVLPILTFTLWLAFPKTYRATVSLMPKLGESSSRMIGLIGGDLAGLLPGGEEMNRTNVFLSILRSNRIRSNLIRHEQSLRQKLGRYAKQSIPEPTDSEEFGKMEPSLVALVGSLVVVSKTPLGLIEITSQTRDYELSRALVMAYVEGLRMYLEDNAVTLAKTKRLFVERSLLERGKEATALSQQLLAFKNGGREVLIPRNSIQRLERLSQEMQTQGALRLARSLESEDPMVLSDTPAVLPSKNNPPVGTKTDFGAFELRPVNRFPAIELEYQNLLRRVEMQNNVLTSLQKEYEMARIEESKESMDFEIIDHPFEWAGSAGPSGFNLFVFATLLSLAAATTVGFLQSRLSLNGSRS
jgi:uncharacterized protein involved in exopolysaccharide biosynthesis